MARPLIALAALVLVAGCAGDPDDPTPTLGQRVLERAALVVRPYLPASMERASDAQVVALGCTALGVGLGALVFAFVSAAKLRRLPDWVRGRQAAHHEARLRRAGPRRDEVEALVRLAGEPDAGASIHESVVVAGADRVALDALDLAAAGEARRVVDFPGWARLLGSPARAQALHGLRCRFAHEVLRGRVLAACRADPQLGGRGLAADVSDDEGWSLAVQLARPDGLGATLDGRQRESMRRIESVIDRTRVHVGNPYALAPLEHALAHGPGKGGPGLVDGVPALALLLFGPPALQRAGVFFTGMDETVELRAWLQRHEKAAGAPAPAVAPAALLAQRSRAGALPGLGATLAVAAGAAVQPRAAALELRKRLPEVLAPVDPAGALAQLGQRVGDALPNLDPDTLLEEAGRALGVDRLEAALEAARGLRDQLGHVEAAVLARRWSPPPLSWIVLERHVRALEAAEEPAAQAAERLLEVVHALASREARAGALGAAPLGAVLVGLDLARVSALFGPDALKLHEHVRHALLARAAQG